jgi:sigma-70-like protein
VSAAERAARRWKRAHALRAEGLSYAQIAERLGVSKATVHADLHLSGPERRPAPVAAAGPANLRALRHGAHSPGLVEGRARELVPVIFGCNPHLDGSRDGPAVFRYAVLLARVERVYRWLGEQGDPVFVDVEAGRAHGVFDRLERWERMASEAEQQLAVAPLTRARLGLDLMQARRSLDDELAEGREAWRRREAMDGGEVSREGA